MDVKTCNPWHGEAFSMRTSGTGFVRRDLLFILFVPEEMEQRYGLITEWYLICRLFWHIVWPVISSNLIYITCSDISSALSYRAGLQVWGFVRKYRQKHKISWDAGVNAHCEWNHTDLTKALESFQPSCFQMYDLQIWASLCAAGQSSGPTRWQICKSVHSIHFTPLIWGQLKQMLLGMYNEVAAPPRLARLDKWTLIDLSLVSIDSILRWKTPKQMGV